MEFTHKENEIVLLDENGNLLAQITFPYANNEKTAVDVNHTFVDTSLRGQGIAGKLMKELIKEIKKFNEERDWDKFHSPENLAKSISIEAGELLECFQWNSDYNLEEVK